jgi:hypothetical protein
MRRRTKNIWYMVLASAMNTMEVDSLSERAEENGSAIDDSEDSVVHD